MTEINTENNNLSMSHQCKICGSPALHSNYGAITCGPCKMFFKRNAAKGLEYFKCNFDGNCKITIDNRHVCSACRLAKCFANEMQIQLIRCPLSTNNENKRKKKIVNESATMISNILFPTLNLLQSDQSTLSTDQWNHISNLIHCYDEYSGLSLAKYFISEQNILPFKLRYKPGAVREFITSKISRVQRLFEKNGDYLCLSAEDRSILLRHTVKHTGCFGATFVSHQTHLFDNPLFYKTAELLFGTYPMMITKHVIDSFDSDITFIKLILVILAFSTTNYTVYNNTSAVNLNSIKTVLCIQDTYIELAWRYMVYKYSYIQAVQRFSHLVRCLFNVNYAIVEVNRVEEYKNIIDSVIEQTEQILTIYSN